MVRRFDCNKNIIAFSNTLTVWFNGYIFTPHNQYGLLIHHIYSYGKEKKIFFFLIYPLHINTSLNDCIVYIYCTLSFRALFDPAFIRDRALFRHVALAAASVELFSTQFTAQSLKATS